MKPSLIITYSVICLLAFAGGIFAGLLYENNHSPKTSAESGYSPKPVLAAATNTPSPVSPPSPSPSASPQSEEYMLCLSDNGISMYKITPDGSTSLFTTKKIDVRHLRQEDYEKLCRGIIADSREEALSLLEGFVG